MAQQYVESVIDATLECDIILDDYGVPRSPTFEVIENVRIASLFMFDRSWTRAELVETFGKQGANALEDLILDYANDDKWEKEEY